MEKFCFEKAGKTVGRGGTRSCEARFQCHLVRDALFPKVTVYGKKRLYTVTFLLCKGDVPMNSAFTYNYELLMSLISELESEINSFVTRPGIDFSRKRKISFQDTILFLLTMRGGSLNTVNC